MKVGRIVGWDVYRGIVARIGRGVGGKVESGFYVEVESDCSRGFELGITIWREHDWGLHINLHISLNLILIMELIFFSVGYS